MRARERRHHVRVKADILSANLADHGFDVGKAPSVIVLVPNFVVEIFELRIAGTSGESFAGDALGRSSASRADTVWTMPYRVDAPAPIPRKFRAQPSDAQISPTLIANRT
jgi:hypothetical protein